MSDQRKDLLSEASTVGSTTSSLRADIAVDSLLLLGLLLHNEDATSRFDDSLTPEQQLGRLLSTRSEISTTSSFAEKQQAAVNGYSSHRLIGWGTCGAIYARDGAASVLKLAKSDDQQLWNDYVMGTRVWEAVSRIPEVSDRVRVPQPEYYVPKSEEGWWTRNQSLFPTENAAVNFPTAALSIRRILPLPSEIRQRLIQKFCAPRNREKALKSSGNRDCLVRLYLGSRTGKAGGLFFSLRNFKLHLNQMRELDMQPGDFAGPMAGALATMHWEAKIDARDVEFVLGSAPTNPLIQPLSSAELEETGPNTYTELKVLRKTNFVQRTVHLWVLDFNQCRRIPMDESGVTLATDAFFLNDPYYPRPPSAAWKIHDAHLWNHFATTYIRVSDRILQSTPELRHLPRHFIKTVVNRQAEKYQSQSEAAAA